MVFIKIDREVQQLMNRERLAKDITRWESVRYEKYKCTSGLWTIGVGHMIRDDEQELLNREKPLTNRNIQTA